MNQILHWSFEGPATLEGNEKEKLAKFHNLRDQIGLAIQEYLAEQGIR